MLYVLRDSILHLDTCHYQWRIQTGFHSFRGNPLLEDLKQERFIDWLLLTLGACARVTVVVLCVSVCVCVCVCVCYHASCHIPRLYVESKVPLSFLWRSQDVHCVDFVENALIKSSGDIC